MQGLSDLLEDLFLTDEIEIQCRDGQTIEIFFAAVTVRMSDVHRNVSCSTSMAPTTLLIAPLDRSQPSLNGRGPLA